MDAVKLMNRIDRKYWFHIDLLPGFLDKLKTDYYVLEIAGNHLMDYATTYYDTDSNRMYLKHHNRKLNRHKVRIRSYLSTGDRFLEVKFKTNKKRTIKNRVPLEDGNLEILESHNQFLQKYSPFSVGDLHCTLHNRFKRITLVHKDLQERCTVDVGLGFKNALGEIDLPNLVVFELKKGRGLQQSPIMSTIRELKIRQSGVSKYCTGRAMLDPGLKQNRFKPSILYLEKKINIKLNYGVST